MAHLWLPAEGGAPLDLDDVVVVDAAVLAKLPDPEMGWIDSSVWLKIGFEFGFGAKIDHILHDFLPNSSKSDQVRIRLSLFKILQYSIQIICRNPIQTQAILRV